MVLSWISRTLSPQIAENVVYIDIDIAQNLWEDWRERFSKGDHFRISYLLQDLHSTNHGEKNVNQFCTNLKIIWPELEFLRPIPNCVCNVPCNCVLSKIYAK